MMNWIWDHSVPIGIICFIAAICIWLFIADDEEDE